jgi:adenosylhomocysteine nucleosidase
MKILIVSALSDEVHGLDESVLITGVGKINATKALERELSKQLPDLVINYGTAGKTTESLSVGDLYEVGKFVQRDMMVTQLGFKEYETPFDATYIIENGRSDLTCGTGDSFWTPSALLPSRLPHIKSDDSVFLATGDCRWTPKNKKNFEIVDMEAYALAKVCQDHGVEFRCFKFISDGGNPDEWKENVSKGSVLFANKLKQIREEETK